MLKMPAFKNYLIFIFLLLDASYAEADVYEFIDEEGQVTYSDNPANEHYVLIIREPITNSQIRQDIHIGPNPTKAAKYITQINTSADLIKYIYIVSSKHKIEPELIHAVIYVESAYKQYAKSKAGAIGLMQLMPATAKRMGVMDIYDPAENIEGGVKYLSQLIKMFDNNIELALAAYNAGEQSVIRYGRKIPPYKETNAYIMKVMTIYEGLKKNHPIAY